MVIPDKFHPDILHLLHDGHPGMTKMKSIARLHFGGLEFDKTIEQFVKTCASCAQNAQDPIKVLLHQWEHLLNYGNAYMSISLDRLRTRCGS